MLQIMRNEDGSYTIMPILKSGADLLDCIYEAYKKWAENECKKFMVVDYRDRTDLHELNQSQSGNGQMGKLP